MAKNEERVMQFVEAELERNPETGTSELFEKAKKVDAGLQKLSLRQFNARYPLQVKRKKSLAEPGRKRKSRARAAGGARGGPGGPPKPGGTPCATCSSASRRTWPEPKNGRTWSGCWRRWMGMWTRR
jgi:hypothetical protein